MTRAYLNFLRTSVFDNEDEVKFLREKLDAIRKKHATLLRRLSEECPHLEVVHTKGCVFKIKELAEIDMPGHFEQERLGIQAPSRMCTFCGLKEIGRHRDGEVYLEAKYAGLPVGQSVNIDPEYEFSKLNQQNREIVESWKETRLPLMFF